MTLPIRVPAKLDLRLILALNSVLWSALIGGGLAAGALLSHHHAARLQIASRVHRKPERSSPDSPRPA